MEHCQDSLAENFFCKKIIKKLLFYMSDRHANLKSGILGLEIKPSKNIWGAVAPGKCLRKSQCNVGHR